MPQFREKPYEKLLIPIDGSATSMAGIYEAVRVAQHIHNPCFRIVYIAECNGNDGFEEGSVGWTIVKSIRDDGQRLLHNAEKMLVSYGLEAECRLVDKQRGRVASGIIDEARAWPADIIIMGSHGRRGIARLALGNTAEDVSRTSMIPVLLVRAAL